MKRYAVGSLSLLLVMSLLLGSCTALSEETSAYSLEWADQVSEWTFVENETCDYYVVENVVYCQYPTHPKNQSISFYVPAAYLKDASGEINWEAEVNGYTPATAPIIYLNSTSGYAGDPPYTPTVKWNLAGGAQKLYWYYNYLKNGFVLAFVGERGKKTYDAEGRTVALAPVTLADLKAGVRFLKHNSGKFPGDTGKIISVGSSAGGAMSALLGVTGNSAFYDPWLTGMGACMDETDDVFASMVYCPIIDLDHAAMAYEWMFGADMTDDSFLSAISQRMRVWYADYVNELALVDGSGNALTVAADGSKSGSFYDWLLEKYEDAYNRHVALNGDTDSEQYDFLTYTEAEGAKLVVPDGYASVLDAMVLEGYMPRLKNCIAFDQVDYGGGSNLTFGVPGAKKNTAESTRHFTLELPALIAELKDAYPEAYEKYYSAYLQDAENPEVQQMVWSYNPYHFITDGDTTIPQYFRINVGTQDRDTSSTVSAVFALLLQKAGYDVEYNLMWNQPHIDADVENGFEDWVNSICKAQ